MSTKRKIESTIKSRSITSFFKPATTGEPVAKKRATPATVSTTPVDVALPAETPGFDKTKWVANLSPEHRELLE